MSAKKGKAVNWYSCAKCSRRLQRSAATKHAEDCQLITYPYIHQGEVYTVIGNATTASRIQQLPFTRYPRLSSSTLFLAEELIKEAGLRTFGWATLVPLEGECVAVAVRIWPIPETIGREGVVGVGMMTRDGFLGNNITCDSVVKIGYLSAVAAPANSALLEIDDSALADIDQVTFDPERFIASFRNWFRGRWIAQDNLFRIRYYAQVISIRVTRLEGVAPRRKDVGVKETGLEEQMKNLLIAQNFLEVTESTEIEVAFKSGDEKTGERKDVFSVGVKLQDVGGLDGVIKEIESTVNFIFSSELQVAPGLIIYGTSGTGKSLLVAALCNRFKLTPVVFNEFGLATSTGRHLYGSSSLRKVFQDALSKSPSAIIIDNIDTLSPSKSSSATTSNSDNNFSLLFQSLVPSLKSSRASSKVVIFALATDIDGLDGSLRSPKIFGKEIELPVPSIVQRCQILEKILGKIEHQLGSEDIQEIAGATHGFVGADLLGLCNQSVQAAIERCAEGRGTAAVSMKDVTVCLKSVKPSAVKSILVDVPNVRWTDIGGQTDLKFKLKQAIEWPLKHPEAFQRLGITPPKGILMYGPPGCSKTMIAKAIATESGLNFISVKGSELFSKWVGESEKAVRDVFRKARQVSPCVVFFDEIDSLGGERGSTSGSSNVHERVLAQLLVELDGIEPLKDVTIVAATNRPDIIDQALLRPGRLDRIIYVPLPDEETRRDILKIAFKKMPVSAAVDVDRIVKNSEGYSGAELTALCHEAAMKSLEEDISNRTIEERHFDDAFDLVQPRITREQLEFYERYSSLHKRL